MLHEISITVRKTGAKQRKTSKDWNPARWHALIMIALRNDKQDDQEFKANLGYVKPHLNKQTKGKKRKNRTWQLQHYQAFMRS